MRVVCIHAQNPPDLTPLAEACLRFTPKIAMSREAIFLDIAGCEKLYSEASLFLRIGVLLKRFHVEAKLAIADDIPTALAFAQYSQKEKAHLPIEALQVFANPFEASDSLSKAIISFRRLGIDTIGELSAIPRKSIAVRFGKEGRYAIQMLENASHIPWRNFTAPLQITEASDVESGTVLHNLEPLLFGLKNLIDRALARLRGHLKLASLIELRLTQEHYSTVKLPIRKFRLELSQPQGTVLSLLPILRDHLDRELQVNPLEAPLKHVEFSILESVSGQGAQKDFFSKKEEEEENFRSIVARLNDKLGLDKAFFAASQESYLPERAWKKNALKPKPVQLSIPERPLRVLKTPRKLKQEEDFFVLAAKRWKVTTLLGPERLSGDWWLQDEPRDYFKALTESGEELWIFSAPGKRDYFLHGIFD